MAACSSPSGTEGEIAYNSTYHVTQFCDGSSWISMAAAATYLSETDPKVGTLTALKWCATNAGGTAIDCTLDAPLRTANNLSDLASATTARTNLGLGSIATQAASAVTITGGTINSTSVGATTPSTGAFTTLSASSTLGVTGVATFASTIVGTTGVGIGTASVAASALLDMVSTAKGLLPPRMTTTQRDAIASPATGLTLYNTTTNQLNIYNGTAWAGPSGGALSGLSDVSLASPSTSQILSYNGSAWTNASVGSLVAGVAGPSFSVNKNGTGQTVSAGVDTLMTWSTEVFDTNNNFASNRFTPTVAGKYIVNVQVLCDTVSTFCISEVWKNGSSYQRNLARIPAQGSSNVTTIVDMNGSTDYLEAYVNSSNGTDINGSATVTYFSGAMLAPLASGVVAGTGSANYVPYWTSGNALTYDSTSGGQFYWDSTNHRLGIGTTSPGDKLHVADDGGNIVFGSPATSYAGFGFGPAALSLTNYAMLSDSGHTLINRPSGYDIAFREANSNQMIIKTGGNVGIGTASPRTSLHVASANASDTFTLGSVSGGFALSTQNNSYGLSAGVLSNGKAWMQAGRFDGTATAYDLMLQQGGGNLGIGTTSASATLDVNGAIRSGASNGKQFTRTNDWFTLSDSTGYTHINWFSYFDGTNWVASHATVKPSQIYANTNGIYLDTSPTVGVGTTISDFTTRLFVANGGSVGIGTTSPNSKAILDVASNTLGFLPPRMTTTQRDAISSPATGLTVYNTTTNALNVYNGSAWVAAGAGAITADSLDFTDFADALTLDASTDIAVTGSNVLSITNSGSGNSLVVNDASGGDTTPFIISATGNVGIGTTAAAAQLSVLGGGTTVPILIGDAGCGGGYGGIGFNALSGCANYSLLGDGTSTYISRPSGGQLSFREANTTQMTIATGGNVAIGTHSPTSRLDIQETKTDTSGTKYLSYKSLTVTPASNSTGLFYGDYAATTITGGSDVGNVYGQEGRIVHNGTGTIATAQGTTGRIYNSSSGTITSAYAAFNDSQILSTGTASASYGAYNRTYSAKASGTAATSAYGAFNITQNSGAGTITSGYGVYNDAQNASTGAITTAYGSFNQVQNVSTGAIATAYGTVSRVRALDSSGTITTAYSILADVINAGTITNWYGLYIPAASGAGTITTKHPLYIADTGSSYFAGSVGIGSTSPAYKLELSHDNDSTVNLLRLTNADATYSQTVDFQLDTNKDLVVTGGSGNGGIAFNMGVRGYTFNNKVGIGTSSVATTALVDMVSTTKGMLPPRMTTTQRDAISSPATGLLIYNTTTNQANIYNGTSWGAVGGGALSGFSDVTLTSVANNDFLKYNGSAWVNVSANNAMTTTTILANWPDAIKCKISTGSEEMFYLQYAPYSSGDVYYRDVYGSQANDFYVRFSSSGAYAAAAPLGGAWDATNGCDKTITQLYAAGRAFNFIGTGAVTTFNVGTAAAPGLAVTSDTNTGLYSSGADSLSITAGGIEAARFETVASGQNYLDFTPSASTNTVTMASAGGGATVPITIDAKGTSSITLSDAVTASSTITGATGVGIGTSSIASTALVDMVSTTKGFLQPRMTTTQRDAISSPATGLAIYNTTTNQMNIYNGTAWGAVGGAISTATDVTLTSVANNDILKYDTGTSKWLNAPITATMAGVAGPSFSVHKNGANQTISSGVWTKLTWSTEVFDTNNNFASDRFTPTVAGKYLIIARVYCQNSTNYCQSGVYKNGSLYQEAYTEDNEAATLVAAAIVDMNGSTDYVEAYAAMGGTLVGGTITDTNFTGSMLAPLASGVVAGTGSAGYVPVWTSGNAVTYDSTASGQFAWDLTNHRLGIGTASPAQKLDITSGYLKLSDSYGLIWDTGNTQFNASPAAGTMTATVGGQNILTMTSTKVGIGTTVPSSKSILDLTSTTLGFLPPRMTTTQRDAISSPATGLMLYNTTTNQANIYNGTSWGAVGGGALSGLSDVTLTSVANGDFLRYNGSAWVNITSNNAMTTTTMVPNFPDAIACTAPGSTSNLILYRQFKDISTGNTWYQYQANATSYYIVFTSAGAYSSTTGLSAYDCASSAKSITTLYSEGNAFNFIGTGAVTTFNVGTVTGPGLALTSDTNTGLYSSGADALSITAGGVEVVRGNTVSSGVNYLNLTPAAAGGGPIMAAAGSDTNIDLNLNGKGTGTIRHTAQAAGAVALTLKGASSQTAELLSFQNNSSSVLSVIDASGYVGIGTSSVSSKAVLDMVSTTRGFLPPRMTTTQRDAISSPATGLLLYNTTTNQANIYNGTAWGAVGGGAVSGLSDVTLTSLAANDMLRYNGSAWVNIPMTTAMTTTTMVANFPDAIACTVTNPAYGTRMLHLAVAPNSDGKYYYREASNGGSTGAIYNSNGTFSSYETIVTSDCGVSISSIYAAGKAFNFIGTGAVTTFNVGTVTAPGLAVTSDTDTGFYQSSANMLSITAGGIEAARFETVASGQNYFDFTPSASTNSVTMASAGGGATVPITIDAKGTSSITLSDAVTASSTITGTTGVGIGTSSIASTALVDMVSTTKGLLPPRMTTTQRDAISSPATGLTIYNTTTNALNLFNGTAWGAVAGSGSIATDSDVTITSVANNDMLKYNSGTSKWVNTPISSAIAGVAGPTFYVTKGGTTQTVSASTGTLLTWSNEVFDTNNNFASNRFTPTVAGKYLILAGADCVNSTSYCYISIYKNGAMYATTYEYRAGETPSGVVSTIVDMNGSTDYVEAWIDNGGGTTVSGGTTITYFSGSMLAPLTSGVVAGTGSAGYVPVWTSGNAITYDSTAANMFAWDLTNHRLGIGTATPSTMLDVRGATNITGAITASSTITGATGVGIGTSSVNSKAVLDLVSTTLGFLPPRMTTTQRDAISSPATGLTIYNTTTNALNLYNGTAWGAVAGTGSIATDSDVTITSVANNDMLKYDSGTSKWVNTPISSAIAGVAGPSFMVHKNGTNQTISVSPTLNVLTWSTETFDTNNNFASNKFTPTVAGKYIVYLSVYCSTNTTTYCQPAIRKNGSVINYGLTYTDGSETASNVMSIVDMNGSTDYVDAAVISGDGTVAQGSASLTYFTGSMLAPLTSGVVAGTGSAGYVPVWTSGNAITYDSTAANMFAWDLTNHRLGIGTATPSTMLDVRGATNITGAITASSTITGATGVGIGTSSVNSKAVLDLVSTTLGFLPPRMTTTQRDAISSPATGLTIYNTTTNALNLYNGTAWGAVAGTGSIATDSDVTITSVADNDILRYDSGTSKWKNVNIGTAMTTTTMVTNWPDGIACQHTDGTKSSIVGPIYWTTGPPPKYRYYDASNSYWLEFNASTGAATADAATPGVSGCASRSISTLYSEGKAFNFIGTGAVTTFDVGTVTAPGLAVTSDTNTGFYQNGTADTLAITLGGTGEVLFTAAATSPVTSDGNALGTSSLMWSDLFLASGGVINFNNGDVTLTHAANTLAFAGAATAYSFDSGVGIGTTSVAASSLLDIVSTTKGFLPPRMTTTQRDAISSPATGLTIYNTTTNALNVYSGSSWDALSTGSGSSLPAHAVQAFNLAACPTGWTEYTAARGRFIRGIDNGAGNDPSGTRAAGNTQADAFQGFKPQFGGGYTASGNPLSNGNGTYDLPGQAFSAGSLQSGNWSLVSDGSSGTPRTATETRPKNVALLYCEKD